MAKQRVTALSILSEYILFSTPFGGKLLKTLLVTTGTRGDVEPFIALAHGLSSRGHYPVLAAPARFAVLATQQGVEFRPLDDSLLEMQSALVDGGMASAMAEMPKIRAAMERSLNDIADLADEPTDLVVYHPKTLATPMIAEKQGVPAIAAQLIPLYQPTAEFPAPIMPTEIPHLMNRATWKLIPLIELPWRKTLRRLRRERFGLTTPLRGISDHIRTHGVLNAWSWHLLAPPSGWNADAAPTGFWRCAQGQWEPPPQLRDFLEAGEAPVYVGFGSMVHKNPEALGQAIKAGVKAAGRRGIIASGSGALAVEGNDDVYVIDSAPHDWVFPRVAAAIHHGGVGTVAAALHAGIPQVIRPFMGDQHFWSRRVEAIGVGLRLRSVEPAAIGEALERALTECVPRACVVGDKVRAERGDEVAVDRLEKLYARQAER
ncbi:MAG: glycosyltransferase [Actinomycetaceae bacterium]|nr:glycosyltransferase [Actinomycetaceae bacterium]